MSSPLALITGGGSGIGLAVAEHLVHFYGYRVAILDIVEERGKAAAERLNAGSDSCLFLHVDASDYGQQAKAFQQAFEWGGNRLDLFFANAGIGDTDSMYKDLFGLDETTGLPKPLVLKTFDVNLFAVMNGVHLARHFFSKNHKKGGNIVVTASCLGVYANHCIPMYVASKHALVGFVRSTAPVYAGMDITINALLPVMIETNLMPEPLRPLWDREQLTPMNTALKAFDTFLADSTMTGQTVELSLDQLIFDKQQEYSTANAKWMCDEHKLWEMGSERLLPHAPGENIKKGSYP